MKLKVKKSYKKPSDAFLLKLCARILESMKNNPYFPNPIPTHAEVEKAYADFQFSLNIAGRNDRTLSSAKNDKKVVLTGMLGKLDDHVTTVSNGDKTMLLLAAGLILPASRAHRKSWHPLKKWTLRLVRQDKLPPVLTGLRGQECMFTNVRPTP